MTPKAGKRQKESQESEKRVTPKAGKRQKESQNNSEKTLMLEIGSTGKNPVLLIVIFRTALNQVFIDRIPITWYNLNRVLRKVTI